MDVILLIAAAAAVVTQQSGLPQDARVIRYDYVREQSLQICPVAYGIWKILGSPDATGRFITDAGRSRGMSQNELMTLHDYCTAYAQGRENGLAAKP